MRRYLKDITPANKINKTIPSLQYYDGTHYTISSFHLGAWSSRDESSDWKEDGPKRER